MTDRVSNHVVFIPGAWMTPGCWDDFRKPFEAAGYTVHTPSWPTLDGGTPEQLRARPPEGLGALSIGAIVAHLAAVIADLPESPLIVGHSFGGLFTQLLLAQGLGVAGIALDPAPIAGVIPGPISLSAAAPILFRWNGWNRPFLISREAFAKTFANTIPPEAQRAAYDRLVVPTSGRIFFQAAAGLGSAAHPRRRAQPLLITVGEKDRTVSPYVARAAARIQRKSLAPTTFKQFAGRSHFLIAEPGWEEVADYCVAWARR